MYCVKKIIFPINFEFEFELKSICPFKNIKKNFAVQMYYRAVVPAHWSLFFL